MHIEAVDGPIACLTQNRLSDNGIWLCENGLSVNHIRVGFLYFLLV